MLCAPDYARYGKSSAASILYNIGRPARTNAVKSQECKPGGYHRDSHCELRKSCFTPPQGLAIGDCGEAYARGPASAPNRIKTISFHYCRWSAFTAAISTSQRLRSLDKSGQAETTCARSRSTRTLGQLFGQHTSIRLRKSLPVCWLSRTSRRIIIRVSGVRVPLPLLLFPGK